MEIAILAGAATAGIKPLLEKAMGSLMNQYSMVFRKLKKDIKKLQKTLEMIEGYLRDLDNKSISGDAVNVWLRELENTAFDADNVLDKLNYHLLPKKTNKRINAVSFSYLKRIPRMRKMALAIRKINKDFKFVSDSAAALGIQYMVANAPPAPADINTSFETDSFSRVPVFVERVGDMTTLVDKLTEEDKRKFYIVAVVGMPGVGKTTLIREVIHDERVKSRFGSTLWVHVSQKFDPINLFKKIHKQLTEEAIDKGASKDDILKKINEALEAKPYLLVLDDVWNESSTEWDKFMDSMSGVTSTTGNGIIISTRRKDVASAFKPFHIHSLNLLSDKGCWSIIKAKAFDGNEEVQPQFEMIGNEIAEKCRGLPLAANLIGGVLYQKSEQQWCAINKKGLSNVKVGEEINKVLKLSLDYLPSPSHKKCFVYCSIFPKGHIIAKLNLIELWMGEGFLQPIQGDDMESTGNMYFNVLLQNSLLQVYDKDDYVMHDVVHDFASKVLLGNTSVRYMFREEDSSHNISKEEAKHLRTLILKGGTSGILFSDFHCLHNLTLGESHRVLYLPDSIRKLIHLRNLDLSDTYTHELPEWIGELSHLQTLRVPWVRYKKLPKTLKYLVNLRHLYIDHGAKLPAGIGRLTSLQTLPYFTVGAKKGYHIEELGNLKNLKGELTIRNLERVRDKEEALKANILQKQHLSELQFEWGSYCSGERNDESVLEGLRPHANLKKLCIVGYEGKIFPTWLRGESQGSCLPLHNLTELKLFGCSECEEITLDHLPNLRSLCIWEFKILKCLSTRFFYNHRNLSELNIYRCDMLEALPDGLDALNSLEELTIEKCKKLKSIGKPSCGEGGNQGILRTLKIRDGRELRELPRQMLELWAPTIEILELDGLISLTNLPMLIDCLTKLSTRLRVLRIRGVPKLMSHHSVESWDLCSFQDLYEYLYRWERRVSDMCFH